MSRVDALMAGGDVERRIVMDAAAWLVRLHGGEMDAAAEAELESWRAQNPAHERAWCAANELAQTFGAVPPGIGMPVLERRGRNRRAAIKTLALVMTVAPASWFAWRESPWREWGADYRTASGEQRRLVLADGSELILNTATAVDIVFDADYRRVVLREGEILIQTAPDSVVPARPLIVQTRHGLVQALGTRFTVRQAAGDDASHVAVLAQRVSIQPSAGAAAIVGAGEQSRFTRERVGDSQALVAGGDAWSRGMLIADGQRLGDFVTELGRYRPGLLRCDPAVADLRISGAFEIGDTAKALSIIAETLPVRVSYRTPYWVLVGPASPG